MALSLEGGHDYDEQEAFAHDRDPSLRPLHCHPDPGRGGR